MWKASGEMARLWGPLQWWVRGGTSAAARWRWSDCRSALRGHQTSSSFCWNRAPSAGIQAPGAVGPVVSAGPQSVRATWRFRRSGGALRRHRTGSINASVRAANDPDDFMYSPGFSNTRRDRIPSTDRLSSINGRFYAARIEAPSGGVFAFSRRGRACPASTAALSQRHRRRRAIPASPWARSGPPPCRSCPPETW